MHATNITELIWDYSLNSLLSLCGEVPSKYEKSASDYEKFLCVCRAISQLSGHPFPLLLKNYLKNCLDWEDAIDTEQAPLLWRFVADYLDANPQVQPAVPWDFSISVSAPSFSVKAEKERPVFLLNQLPITKAQSWQQWKAELYAAGVCAIKQDRKVFYLDLSAQIEWKVPSLYHVESALQGKMDPSLLFLQLLRFYLPFCRENQLTLMVAFPNQEEALALHFLGSMEQTVGLSQMVLVSQSNTPSKHLIDFCAAGRGHLVQIGYRCETPEDAVLALSNTCHRYPVGRFLPFSLGADQMRRFAVLSNKN